MSQRILVGEITGIKKLSDGKKGGAPVYRIDITMPSNPIRIHELKLGKQCSIEYDVIVGVEKK